MLLYKYIILLLKGKMMRQYIVGEAQALEQRGEGVNKHKLNIRHEKGSQSSQQRLTPVL
jgi:hypothetical protein